MHTWLSKNCVGRTRDISFIRKRRYDLSDVLVGFHTDVSGEVGFWSRNSTSADVVTVTKRPWRWWQTYSYRSKIHQEA